MRPRARRVLLGLAALAAVGIALAWTLRAELALAVAASAARAQGVVKVENVRALANVLQHIE